MSKSTYATDKTFAGQRASIARNVVVKWDDEICAGIIVGVNLRDEPIIRIFGRSGSAAEDGAANRGGFELTFHEVKSADEIEKAPARCWFWPPRV